MEGNIRGSFPGGPRKSVPAARRTAPPRLESVEELEERRALRRLSRRRKARVGRLFYGLLASVLLAGGVGVALGVRSHATVQKVCEEEAAARSAAQKDQINQEVNRTLLELWKMEDVEYARNSR